MWINSGGKGTIFLEVYAKNNICDFCPYAKRTLFFNLICYAYILKCKFRIKSKVINYFVIRKLRV